MPVGRATIHRSATNGPFIYEFEVDGDTQSAAVNIANLGAAMDAVKPLFAALPGTIQRLTITATST